MILTVLLTILKIIGIILLSVLGLVLFLLIIILFVPIRYKASFVRTGIPDDPPIQAKATASWLLHIIHVSVSYETEMNLTIRVFGIAVNKLLEKKSPKDNNGKTNRDKKNKKEDTRENETNTEIIDSEIESIDSKEADIRNNSPKESDFESTDLDGLDFDSTDLEDSDFDNTDSKEFALNSENSDEYKSDGLDSEEEKTIFSRITDFINKIKYTIKNVYDKLKSIGDNTTQKIEATKKNIHYYHRVLTSDLFERTFEKCKKKLIRLIKEIMPRKLDICMEAGFDNPYTTGEMLAIAGMLYPFWGEHVRIIANWEEQIIKGAGRLSGRIYLFSLAKLVIYAFTNRDFKRLLRLLKKEEHKNGRKQ